MPIWITTSSKLKKMGVIQKIIASIFKGKAYQDVQDDNSKPKWRESRKTKLTLKQLRKLRRMNDVRNYESKNYLKKVQQQYGAKAEAQSAM
jgi:hypothetical protein